MESCIQISKINDFLFCPLSLYFHIIYENFCEETYHHPPQKIGRINHKPIEKCTYSTLKRYLQSLPVYSERYNISGKIDVFDQKTNTLIERKTKIKQIYQGHVYQLYAQMFCLEEMGYIVKKLIIHSLQDNKRYNIPLPAQKEKHEFETVIDQIKKFRAVDYINHRCPRCRDSIYGQLSW